MQYKLFFERKIVGLQCQIFVYI